LRFKLVICACLLVAPTVLGGACGAANHLLPKRSRFGEAAPVQPTSQENAPTITQACLTGAAAGGVIGAAACIAFAWAGRQKKRW
jgi:hypothetical protein